MCVCAQVQDAGLVFMSAIASTVVESMDEGATAQEVRPGAF